MGITGSQMALMQCRSGIARSDATRSDYYYGSLAATIGGVDRGATFRKRTLEIVDVLNHQPDTATAIVFGFDPAVGQEIILGSGAINNRVFGGYILRAEQLSVKKAAKKFWRIDCTDYTWLLNKRRVTKRYGAQAAHLIVIDLITNFAPGFTTANVKTSSPSTGGVLEFKAEPIGDAIVRLAGLVGWNFYPDYSKDIHFFDTETTQAPVALTEASTTYSNLVYRPSIDQIRTRVFGEGGGGSATAPVAAGSVTIPVDECVWYGAAGGSVVSGSNIITYTGRSAASGPGNLTGIPAAGTGSILYAVSQGDPVNIWVQVDDAAAQAALAALEGGDGIHEYYVSDGRLSIAGATARAQAELTAFSTIDYQGSHDSIDKFNRSGKSLVINLPGRGINTSVVLQKVTRRYIGQDKWGFRCEFARFRRDFVDVLRDLGRSA